MSDLVRRLRDAYDKVSCFPENMHDGFMRLIELSNIAPEAADRIEKLERELTNLHNSYWELDHNYRVESSYLSALLEKTEDQLAAEKALADLVYEALYFDRVTDRQLAIRAYRKARGL